MRTTHDDSESLHENARYEYRVWGRHRIAGKKLARMASTEVREEIEDCYLLVDDDEWNAKVRNGKLKVKQLISGRLGFEHWTSQWHSTAKSAPPPFDEVFKTLRLDRPQRGKAYDLSKAVAKLDDSDGARAVFVTKYRRRFRVGAVVAEITKIKVHDSAAVLHSIAVQGDDVGELESLLRKLGLDGLPNVAMHVAIETETSTPSGV